MPAHRLRSVVVTEGPAVDRRGFLRWMSAITSALTAALVGVPVVRTLVSPAFARPARPSWAKVADDVTQLELGVPVRADFVRTVADAWVESRSMNSVWLYTEDGERLKAYNGHCTHLGCSYGFDRARGVFVCPCHRGAFDVKTGAVLGGPPPRALDELPVEVRDGAVYVAYRDYRLGVPQRVEA